MKIPVVEIESVCAYIDVDLQNGIQIDEKEWRETLGKIRTWLDAQSVQIEEITTGCGVILTNHKGVRGIKRFLKTP